MTPQNVVAAIAVEIARAGDMPAGRNIGQRNARIVDEPAIGRPQPVGQQAIVVAPQNVAAPVAVKIVAGIGHYRVCERQLHASTGCGRSDQLSANSAAERQSPTRVGQRRSRQGKTEAWQAGVGDDDLVAGGEVYDRVAIEPRGRVPEAVASGAAGQRVGSRSADQLIVAGPSAQRVDARASVEQVGGVVADQRVASRPARRIFDRHTEGDADVPNLPHYVGEAARIEVDPM